LKILCSSNARVNGKVCKYYRESGIECALHKKGLKKVQEVYPNGVYVTIEPLEECEGRDYKPLGG